MQKNFLDTNAQQECLKTIGVQINFKQYDIY